MPNPDNYKPSEKSKYMQECMHIVVKEEGKKRDQGIAQCLNVWKQHKEKKMASSVLKRFSSIKGDLSKAEKSDKPSVFLGGVCDKDNQWRKDLKEEFQGVNFIDPYDPDWDPADNIYNELTGILKVDHVIFYKGGDGTKKEKNFMNSIGKKYKEFDDIEELRKYLIGIKE